MEYRALGESGIQASIVGLGAWVMGGGITWGENPDDHESVRVIQAALDLGINLVDTAPAYGWGRSEKVVGKALKGRRDRAVLATKCGLWWENPRGSFFAELDGKKMYRCLRPDSIQTELENSLRRLGTDYIDLYQVHWPSSPPEQTPIEETMAALLKFKEQGKIRAIGVSNVTLEELQEYVRCGPVASDQFRYSLLNRDAEKDILPSCQQKKLATLAYMPLEQGLLTGKVGMDRVFRNDEFRSNADWNPWIAPVNRKRVLAMLDGWKELAHLYGCTLGQLTIAWTAAQAGLTHVLCGARTQAQLVENAKAGDLQIAKVDLERIRADAIALGAPKPA